MNKTSSSDLLQMQASLLDILNSESFRPIIIQQEKLAKSLQPTLDTLRIQSAALSKALQPSIDAFQATLTNINQSSQPLLKSIRIQQEALSKTLQPTLKSIQIQQEMFNKELQPILETLHKQRETWMAATELHTKQISDISELIRTYMSSDCIKSIQEMYLAIQPAMDSLCKAYPHLYHQYMEIYETDDITNTIPNNILIEDLPDYVSSHDENTCEKIYTITPQLNEAGTTLMAIAIFFDEPMKTYVGQVGFFFYVISMLLKYAPK